MHFYLSKQSRRSGFKVVFGHTDYIFVTMPKEWTQEKVYDESIALAKVLTDHVRAFALTRFLLNWRLSADKYFIAEEPICGS